MINIIIENIHETKALGIHNEPVNLSVYYYNSKKIKDK